MIMTSIEAKNIRFYKYIEILGWTEEKTLDLFRLKVGAGLRNVSQVHFV